MRKVTIIVLLILAAMASSAAAASLDGRLGVTAKAGALVPVQDDFISSTTMARTGLAAGGGLIFGIGRGVAAEVDVTRAPGFDVEIGGSKAYEAALTDVAIGVQYRLLPDRRLVPFFGLGADFIKGDLRQAVTGTSYDLDWTEGGHVNAGIDIFITDSIAFTAEGRFLFAVDGDVKTAGAKSGSYDPTSFIATVGFRLILPKDAFR
ncbi:porin family protein [Geomonas sp. Red32]|uniref:outer membrane beta-barrel protein n=1 Tax=Geomonas sp. Red32 TaxID=2912856 RepID=UPI00202CF14A|nr:outer membrane beta-barrel protein [Geomonas sp. Red32]MCM0082886.1 porin family protein [Geomonas sp. Red32]